WGDAPFPWVEPQVERSGHFIRWNLVADIGGCRVEDGRVIQDNENSCGIYLDDYTSNCTIWGNVFLRTGMGVVFHGGKHNVAENNIFVGCRCQLRVSESVSDRSGHEPMIGWNVGNRFCRNICTFDDPEAVISHLSCSRKEKIVHADAFVGQMDENLYHSTSGAYICVIPVTSGETYDEWHKRIPHDEWRQRGFDWNSVIADPLFLDPANDDYRLSADSPALKLGFVPIELSHVGIRAG
ncbi:MAG: hypothetical protein QGG69_05725, partial [Kiritimatiellia bacterium]|nr:hypothetical protein [Kiritimatiellia bacterium]